MIDHPAFQSAVAPLASSLLIAVLMKRYGPQWQGLSVITGLVIAVWLTVGLDIQPLTSTRKIILSSLLSPLLVFPLSRIACPSSCQKVILISATALVSLWIIWPVLARQDVMDVWVTGGRVLVFVVIILSSLSWLTRGDFARQGGALFSLGLGTGTVTFIGSSALYGQLSFAVTAAVGGLVLARIMMPAEEETNTGFGNLGLFAAGIPLSLIAGAATVYAKLPAMALLFLVFIPLFAAIPVARKWNIQNIWMQGILAMVLGSLPAIPAVWVTLKASEPLGY